MKQGITSSRTLPIWIQLARIGKDLPPGRRQMSFLFGAPKPLGTISYRSISGIPWGFECDGGFDYDWAALRQPGQLFAGARAADRSREVALRLARDEPQRILRGLVYSKR